MRMIIQRVASASVSIEKEIVGKINHGLLLFVGFEQSDTHTDMDWIIKKVLGMRVFSDSDQKMNLSIEQVNGSLLIISQFTLFASTKKGNRPSFIRSASPDEAKKMYDLFIEIFKSTTSRTIETGEFGANMKVSLINDGPVTISIDSNNRE